MTSSSLSIGVTLSILNQLDDARIIDTDRHVHIVSVGLIVTTAVLIQSISDPINQ